jgi:hypothetical protein
LSKRYAMRPVLAGLISAICTFAINDPAWSQTAAAADAYASAPADHKLVTRGQVDLRSGKSAFSQVDLSIGDELLGLKLERRFREAPPSHSTGFANFMHNFDIYLFEKRVDYAHGRFQQGQGVDYRIGVKLGERSETFDGEAYRSAFQSTSKGAISWLTYSGDRNSGSVVYKMRSIDGTVVTFRPLGSNDCMDYLRCAYASQIDRPDGLILSLAYDQGPQGGSNSTRLRSVESSRGYGLYLEYDGMLIVKACVLNLGTQSRPSDGRCPAGALATSEYVYGGDPSGTVVLASAKDAANQIWRYGYGGTSAARTMTFFDPGAAVPRVTNQLGHFWSEDSENDVVYSQSFADGTSLYYDYTDVSSLTNGTINQIAGGSVTDNQGRKLVALYDFPLFPRTLTPGYGDGQEETLPNPGDPGDPGSSGFHRSYQITPGPASVTDELGQVTRYDYCDPAAMANLPSSETDRCIILKLQSYTDPDNAKTDVVYGSNGLITFARRHPKPGSTLTNIELTTGYDCSDTSNQCTKPSFVKDGNGGITYLGYTAFGAIAWQIAPPPVNGAARPLKLFNYVQKITASPIAGPIWITSSEITCQTAPNSGTARPQGVPSCDGAAPVRTATYEYGADGSADALLVRGVAVTADGQTRRTCYGYDGLGNRISETKPRAVLGVCP